MFSFLGLHPFLLIFTPLCVPRRIFSFWGLYCIVAIFHRLCFSIPNQMLFWIIHPSIPDIFWSMMFYILLYTRTIRICVTVSFTNIRNNQYSLLTCLAVNVGLPTENLTNILSIDLSNFSLIYLYLKHFQ